jgi:hypothetical protein
MIHFDWDLPVAILNIRQAVWEYILLLPDDEQAYWREKFGWRVVQRI